MPPGDAYPGWLVAGLGNPDKRYERTRHNVGFDVADVLADRWGLREWSKKFHGWFASARPREFPDGVLLLKPLTFMNLSGRAVQAAMTFHRVLPARTLVIHDDLDLDVGVVRIKVGGGTAGHRGLESIVSVIGREFVRLRVGIGRPTVETTDYVLSTFSAVERKELETALPLAADAAIAVIAKGPAAAMNEFHGRTRNRGGSQTPDSDD